MLRMEDRTLALTKELPPPTAAAIAAKTRFISVCDQLKQRTVWPGDMMREAEDSLKEIVKECHMGQVSNYTAVYNKDIFDNIGFILSRLLPSSDHNAATKLSSPVLTIFTFIAEVAKDVNFRSALRDEYGLLETVTQLFDPALPSAELDLILRVGDLLTKDAFISWKAPYIRKLVDKLYTLIQSKFDDKPKLYLVLQILINICRRNVSCILIVHEDPKSKFIWKILKNGLTQDMKTCGKQELLIGHFLYLTTSTISSDDFISGYELVELSINQLIEKYENSDPNESAQLLCCISDMVSSIAEKMRPIYERCDSSFIQQGSSAQADAINNGKAAYIELVQETMSKMLGFVTSHKLDSACEASSLRFLLSVLPRFIPIKHLLNSYLEGLQIAELLFSNSSAGQLVYNMCIQFYLHVAEQLLDSSSDDDRQSEFGQKLKEIERYFHKALGRINLVAEELSTMSIQLLSAFSKQSCFSAKVLEKLDIELIRTMIKKLSITVDMGDKISFQRSCCIVELLCLMSQFTREPAIFNLMMQLINNPDIAFHIASCVQQGDERTVTKALLVTGSMGFSQNNLTSIARSIVTLRTRPTCTSRVEMLDGSVALGYSSGVKRVNDLLKSVNALEEFETSMDSKKRKSQLESQDASLVSLGDIITCYKMKQEILELEITNLCDQVCQINKVKTHLNSLVTKQSALLSNSVLEKEKCDKEFILLQNKIDKSFKKSTAVNEGLAKDLEKMRESLEEAQKLLQEKELLYGQVEAELKATKKSKNEATTQAKSYRQEKVILTEELDKLKAAFESVTAKYAKLDQDLKTKKDELASALLQLEQQKQVVNTIRGLIGHNTFGSLTSQNP